eukprot:GEMP01022957.1.p1 GENE.GEMP01022957.1~~GEMP01022957.1.p1  ORF type:complete len:570 (+),score=73.05 GEMP01022957.1:23-1711(+)
MSAIFLASLCLAFKMEGTYRGSGEITVPIWGTYRFDVQAVVSNGLETNVDLHMTGDANIECTAQILKSIDEAGEKYNTKPSAGTDVNSIGMQPEDDMGLTELFKINPDLEENSCVKGYEENGATIGEWKYDTKTDTITVPLSMSGYSVPVELTKNSCVCATDEKCSLVESDDYSDDDSNYKNGSYICRVKDKAACDDNVKISGYWFFGWSSPPKFYSRSPCVVDCTSEGGDSCTLCNNIDGQRCLVGTSMEGNCNEGTCLIKNGKSVCSCIAGSMEMFFPNGTAVSVEKLKKGDKIRGIVGEKMESSDNCEVLTLHKVHDNAPTVDHFTADHFILRDGDDAVVPYGHGSNESIRTNESIYTLTTTCDAVVNAAGVRVTSFSSGFCGRTISWKETIELTNILRDALDGAPWLNLSIYHNSNTSEWNSALRPLCDAMLECLKPVTCDNFDCKECNKLDDVTRKFIRDHVDKRYHANIRASQCSRDHALCTLNDTHIYVALIRRNRVASIVLLTSTVVGAALLLFAVCVAEACRRRWKHRTNQSNPAELQPQSKESVAAVVNAEV